MEIPNITSLDKALVEDDICPKCLGELDTGWECNECDFDAIEIVNLIDRV